eukprot:g14152.t1
MEQHPLHKLESEDCASLYSELCTLDDQFHEAYVTLTQLEFDIDKALGTVENGGKLLEGIRAKYYIALPSNTASLTLAHRLKYHQIL